MRRLILIILAILYELGLCAGITSDQQPSEYIGTPSTESYTEKQTLSRTPWDMVLIDDKIYLGGGDYTGNTGPVDIWCYDISTKQWTISGTLNDEAIGKFITIGDRVYAPGFDSKGGTWDYGNYHWMENGQWHTNETLPDAVHNFDITQYDGKLFFALGTDTQEDSPVKISIDDGLTFQDVQFYKADVNILSSDEFDYSRVYDFFTIDDALYCMLLTVKDGAAQTYDFYKYQNDAFYYISNNKDIGLNIKAIKQEPISSKVQYKDRYYIAAGYLSRTKDFTSSEWLVLPQGELAIDLLVDDDRLYILSGNTDGEKYTVRIYSYIYNSFFFPIASFESQSIPVSFVKNGNAFYVGLSNHGNDETAAGSIYEVHVSDLTF